MDENKRLRRQAVIIGQSRTEHGHPSITYGAPRRLLSQSRSSLTTTTSSSTCSSSLSSLSSSEYQQEKDILLAHQDVIDHFASIGVVIGFDKKATWLLTSPVHPRNWSLLRKCYDTAIILFLEFLMTLVSNTGSSTAEQTHEHFNITKKTGLLCFTFAYLCGQACGGLLLPPVSETFGGQAIYVLTTALFGIGNLLIGAFPYLPMIVTARFLTGFFSAMPGTVAAGTIENMWDVRARIWTIHLWIVTAVLGLASGPAVATTISLSPLGWRWVYMILGLVSIAAAVCCMLMKESRPSKILLQRIQQFERTQSHKYGLWTEDSAAAQDFRTFCHTSLLLPVQLFFTEPIVMLTSTMAASVYAIIYIFPEALPHVYHDFGFSTSQISFVNLAITCGIPLTFLPRFMDIWLANRRQQRNQTSEPEDKITGFILAAPCLTISFFVFAASVPPLQPHVTPWVSMVCLAGVGFSTVEFDNVLSGYLTDSYSSYAASANAPMAFLRAMLSGIFPLFASDMFTALGANNAIFILAGLSTLYCLASIWFAKYGKRFRERSKFATKIAHPQTVQVVDHGNKSEWT